MSNASLAQQTAEPTEEPIEEPAAQNSGERTPPAASEESGAALEQAMQDHKDEQAEQAENADSEQSQGQDTPKGSAKLREASMGLPEQLKNEIAESEVWRQKVDTVIASILSLDADSEDADKLYLDLDSALRQRLDHLRISLAGARSPLDPVPPDPNTPERITNISELADSITVIYDARLRLMEHISPYLLLEITATDVIGVQALKLELEVVWLTFRFQALSIPAAANDLLRRIEIAPLPIIWRFLEMLLALGIFRWWRRWLPETLRSARASLLEIRPRSTAVLRRVKLIWYLEQVRKPIEWLILFNILIALIDMPGLNFILGVFAIVVQWILLGWFSVFILNAVAARGDVGLTGDDARLRMNSLRLVATWMVLLGLGLDLAESLAGVATLYAWVWRLFQFVAFPVIIILLSWWRKPVFTRLELEKESSEAVRNMLQHQSGIRSYTSAASGVVWLLANSMRRSLMRTFLRFGNEPALITAIPTNRAGLATGTDSENTPLSTEQLDALLRSESNYDRFARPERREVVRLCNSGQGGIVALVGERGIGKSSFLQQVSDECGDKLILLDCRSSDFALLERDLLDALGIAGTSRKRIAQKISDKGIQAIAVDNLHRLSRPIMNGQGSIAELNELIEAVRLPVQWIFGVDAFAWQFLLRVRADRATVSELINMPTWTEEQISEMLSERCEEAGLSPNYSTVTIPRDYRETGMETAEARKQAGLHRMIWDISGGNAGVALRLLAGSLSFEKSGRLNVDLPTQLSGREIDKSSLNVLLVLRAIAQSEQISVDDIVNNLRLPQGAVGSAMHFALTRGWIEEANGFYRLSWLWYRTVTRILGRQNLLAR